MKNKMIFTNRTITVRKGESRIDEPIVVYRGDYELEVRFTILNSKFNFKSGTNMIETEKASYGQLAILTPYGGNIFSDIVKCNDGSVTFVLTADMLNQIEEVGLYSFQIRLMDYNKESRVSIPPIEFGIEVREPIASEDHDNSVNNAIVGYSIAKVVDPKEENVGDTFDESGNYNKTKWETGDRISEGKLNKIEDAIDKVNENEVNNTATLSKRIDNNFNVLDATKAERLELDTLSNRVDNLIGLPDGSTSGDAELTDARIAYNGVVYNNVGNAIRGQVGDMYSILENSLPKLDNLYTSSVLNRNQFVQPSGNIIQSDTYSYFEVTIVKGVTYMMYPRIRILVEKNSKGDVVYGNDISVHTNKPVSYTATVTGTLLISVFNEDIENNSVRMCKDGQSFSDIPEYGGSCRYLLSNSVSMGNHSDMKKIHEKINTIIDTDANMFNDCELHLDAVHREGHIIPSTDHAYFKVPVDSNKRYIMSPRVRQIDFYNKKGELILFSEEMDSLKNPTITPPEQTEIMYITIYKSDLRLCRLTTDDNIIYDVPFYGDISLRDNVRISNNRDFALIKDDITSLSNYIPNKNLLCGAPRVENHYYNSGKIVESIMYDYYKISLKAGNTYTFYPRIRVISLYYEDTMEFYKTNEENTGKPTYFTPDRDSIAYVTFFKSDIGIFVSTEYKDFDLIDDVDSNTNTLSSKVNIKSNGIVAQHNLLTGAPCVNKKYIHELDIIRDSDMYCYYRVYLRRNTTYYMYPRIRGMVVYDLAGNKILNNFDSVDTSKPATYTPDDNVVAYITYFLNDENKQLSTLNNRDEIEPIGYKFLDSSIIIPDLNTVKSELNKIKSESMSQSNILYGKKWAVIGDSFTAGDFNGFTDSNGLSGKNSPELYDAEIGMWKTYPWWIMKRNNMTIQNFFAGGRTLATPADGTFRNSITYNDMYKQIDADVDYITIYLGINDGHHMPGSNGDDGEDISGAIPIGTENDTTIDTFYGAWNVLLKDLITLYPFAHIGILVSNGMDTDEHVNATIKMAKKWGIPYLNLDSGYDVPLLLRSRQGCRPETCQEAIDIRRDQQRVSSTNWHPNHQTHKYESTFIEDFLRRI